MGFCSRDQSVGEQAAWLKLGVLDDPTLLSDGDWPALRQAYAEAAMLNARIKLITRHVLSVGTLAGGSKGTFEGTPGAKEAASEFCRPIVSG